MNAKTNSEELVVYDFSNMNCTVNGTDNCYTDCDNCNTCDVGPDGTECNNCNNCDTCEHP